MIRVNYNQLNILSRYFYTFLINISLYRYFDGFMWSMVFNRLFEILRLLRCCRVLRYRPSPAGYIDNIRYALAVVWLRLPALPFAMLCYCLPALAPVCCLPLKAVQWALVLRRGCDSKGGALCGQAITSRQSKERALCNQADALFLPLLSIYPAGLGSC